MQYLLLAILSIIVYAEVLPTISLGFEWIRTWIAAKIAIIQLETAQMQEDLQESQERLEKQSSHAIGFAVPTEMIDEEDEYYE